LLRENDQRYRHETFKTDWQWLADHAYVFWGKTGQKNPKYTSTTLHYVSTHSLTELEVYVYKNLLVHILLRLQATDRCFYFPTSPI